MMLTSCCMHSPSSTCLIVRWERPGQRFVGLATLNDVNHRGLATRSTRYLAPELSWSRSILAARRQPAWRERQPWMKSDPLPPRFLVPKQQHHRRKRVYSVDD